MRSQNFVITQAQLNAATELEINPVIPVYLYDATTTIEDNRDIHPQSLSIVNGSGATVRYRTLTESEYKEYAIAKTRKGFFEIDLGSPDIVGATTLTAPAAATYDIAVTGSFVDTVQFTIAGTDTTVNALVTKIDAGAGSTGTLTATLIPGSGTTNTKIKVELDQLTGSAFMTPDLSAFFADIGAKLTGGPFTVTIGNTFATLSGFDYVEIANGSTFSVSKFPKSYRTFITGTAGHSAGLTLVYSGYTK